MSGQKVLVVDDEEHILELTRLYLSREGYQDDGVTKVALRPKEFDLLALLARHPGRVFQRSELLDLVWGYDFPGYTRTVDVHVQQVREKLSAAGVADPVLETVWGVGYRLELDAAS